MNDRNRVVDVKIGLFVLAALILLILGSLWIAGSTFVGPRRLSYEVLMKDSGGLQTGDRVRVAGVSVGRIQEVVLRPDDEWPVLFKVAIRESIPMRIDGKARITTSGLLGTAYLQIDPGSPSAAVLREGGQIKGDAAVGFEDALARLDELSAKVVSLLDQVSTGIDPILANLNNLLSEDNVGNIEGLLATLNGTVSEAGPRISSLLARLETMSASMERGTEDLPEISAGLSALVEDLRAALGPDGSRLADVIDAAQGSLSSADETLSVLSGNRGTIEATVWDLQETVSNLKSFSQQLKERPFSMVRKVREPGRSPGDGAKESRP